MHWQPCRVWPGEVGCLEELVVQNALHVVVSAVGQHKTGRLIVG